jgi:hypothetical protein
LNTSYDDWVSGLRLACTARDRWGEAISATGCSSSLWPTATASDGYRGGLVHKRGNLTLRGAAETWPTPTATLAQGCSYTPDRGQAGAERLTLAGMAQMWPPPVASASDKGGLITRRGSATLLATAIDTTGKLWATPVASDYRSGAAGPAIWRHREKPKNARPLREQAYLYSPPAQVTQRGRPSLQRRPRLNPRFVDWLMGWPPGWSAIEPTGFALSATGWSRWLRLARSCISSALTMHALPPPKPVPRPATLSSLPLFDRTTEVA